jgi:glycosyltransferase involved in cell wall biosynthesis
VQIAPISFILPVRNEGMRLLATIRSIIAGRSRVFPLEFVIVDDASSDGACDTIENELRNEDEVQFVVRRLPEWSGIPFARNRGAEIATSPIYFITDANTLFPSHWDLPIWRHLSPGRMLAATIVDIASPFRGYGCQLLLPSMGVTWIPVPFAYGGQIPVSPCTGSVIDRALFHHLGGYDEALPVYGAAEPEFSVRLWLSGYEVVNVPELQIRHRFRPRAEHDAYRASIRTILLRNYLRFACYYLPLNRLERTYEHYAGPSSQEFAACMDDIVSQGVWARRAQLSRLPLQFEWLVRRFGMDGVSAAGAASRGRSQVG